MPRLLPVLVALLLPALAATPAAADPAQDATVVAVIDSGYNPYHWDLASAHLPQHLNADPSDDLPLDRRADEWLPGFDRSAFGRLDRLDLSLRPDDADARAADLRAQDGEAWAGVPAITPQTDLDGVWLPGTKVIGALQFGNASLYGGPSAHGNGTSSSVVGNLHGTCPECLVVLIKYSTAEDAERALEWAESQPWIDLVSNSYGFSDVFGRDRIYSGSDTAKQRAASERGQTLFFSSGNGINNDFITPNPTTFSSQEGPDWTITVGAVSPATKGPYTGAGKPADVAGIGSRYHNAYGAATVGGTGASGFGGTSNATPQVAGTYARSLLLARQALGGPSRVQAGGAVATGTPVACAGCPLGDGVLTATELRRALLHGAVHRAGTTITAQGQDTALPTVGEEVLLAEGHGSYLGRGAGPEDPAWRAEAEQVVLGPLTGATAPPVRPAGEREWFVVDSFCRQRNWGAWSGGDYVEGQTALPGPSPTAPVRSAREATCPGGPLPLP